MTDGKQFYFSNSQTRVNIGGKLTFYQFQTFCVLLKPFINALLSPKNALKTLKKMLLKVDTEEKNRLGTIILLNKYNGKMFSE